MDATSALVNPASAMREGPCASSPYQWRLNQWVTSVVSTSRSLKPIDSRYLRNFRLRHTERASCCSAQGKANLPLGSSTTGCSSLGAASSAATTGKGRLGVLLGSENSRNSAFSASSSAVRLCSSCMRVANAINAVASSMGSMDSPTAAAAAAPRALCSTDCILSTALCCKPSWMPTRGGCCSTTEGGEGGLVPADGHSSSQRLAGTSREGTGHELRSCECTNWCGAANAATSRSRARAPHPPRA
eukprot:1592770-Prymnesium_polylepis.2